MRGFVESRFQSRVEFLNSVRTVLYMGYTERWWSHFSQFNRITHEYLSKTTIMLVHKSGQAYLVELGYEPKVNSLMNSLMLTYLEISPATQAMLYFHGQMITKMYFRVLRPQDIPLSDRCYNIRCQVWQSLRRCIEKIQCFHFYSEQGSVISF